MHMTTERLTGLQPEGGQPCLVSNEDLLRIACQVGAGDRRPVRGGRLPLLAGAAITASLLTACGPGSVPPPSEVVRENEEGASDPVRQQERESSELSEGLETGEVAFAKEPEEESGDQLRVPAPTEEETPPPTPTATSTPRPSSTPTQEASSVPTGKPTPTATPTEVAYSSATPTATENPTDTPEPTATPTATPVPTKTATSEPTATKEVVWQFEQIMPPEYAQLNLWRPEDAEKLVQMGLITQNFDALSGIYAPGAWQDFKFAPKPQVYIWQRFLNDLHTYQLFPNGNPEYPQWYETNKDKMSGWEQRQVVLAYASSHNGILVAPGGVKFDIRNGLHFTAQLGPSFTKEILPDGLVWGNGALGLICRVNAEGKLETGNRHPNCKVPGTRCDLENMDKAKAYIAGSINQLFYYMKTLRWRSSPDISPEEVRMKLFPAYLIGLDPFGKSWDNLVKNYGLPPEELVPYLP